LVVKLFVIFIDCITVDYLNFGWLYFNNM
jgi:hypothetical protein